MDTNVEILVDEIKQPTQEQQPPPENDIPHPESKPLDGPTAATGESADKLPKARPGDSMAAAELIVAGIEMASSITLKKLHQAKFRKTIKDVYGTGAEERLHEINTARSIAAEKGEAVNLQLNEKDFEMLFYQNRHKAILDDLPFSDSENERMVKAYTKLMDANGGDLPPITGMVIATAITLAPRIVDAIVEKV